MNLKWHNEKRKISDLKPAKYNPRKWSEKETKNLTDSLDKLLSKLCEFKNDGWCKPIIAIANKLFARFPG